MEPFSGFLASKVILYWKLQECLQLSLTILKNSNLFSCKKWHITHNKYQLISSKAYVQTYKCKLNAMIRNRIMIKRKGKTQLVFRSNAGSLPWRHNWSCRNFRGSWGKYHPTEQPLECLECHRIPSNRTRNTNKLLSPFFWIWTEINYKGGRSENYFASLQGRFVFVKFGLSRRRNILAMPHGDSGQHSESDGKPLETFSDSS